MRYVKVTLVFFFVYLALFASYCTYFSLKESAFSGSENVIIDSPRNLNDISRIFVDKGISNNAFMAKLVIRVCAIFGYKVKFGEYRLPENVSLLRAIYVISLGRQVVHKFCIPEGLSVIQVLDRLKKNEFLKGDIAEIPEEGSLLPDTYCFKYPETRQGIINLAQKAMKSFIEQEWKSKSNDCFLKTPQEVITLASMVQKESNIHLDVIAGMYLNRLKKSMKLQSCPTVIYAMARGGRFSRRLKYEDLKVDSPYNTYKYNGLPPSPITNPGKSAILSVLHPQKSEWLYMYFDRSISQPAFAKTYKEHKANIARIRNIDISKVR